LPSPFDAEDLSFVSLAMTEITGDVGVGKELQFHFFVPIAVAGRAGAFLRIETEIARSESQIFAIGGSGKKRPDMIKSSDECCWTRSRSFAYARLVYIDDVFDLLMSLDGIYG
jgi:hypothetical protein